jgi:HEAT repeat protein
MIITRFGLKALAGTAVALLSSHALAQGAAPQPRASAAAGTGQGPLTLSVDKQAAGVVVLGCTKASCSTADLHPIAFDRPPPADAAPATARLAVLPVGQGRSVIRVELGGAGHGWEALVAAPLGEAANPVVIWSGPVPDLAAGEADAGSKVEASEGDGGVYKVLVGEVRKDLNLCGRSTLLSPKVIDPSDLKLKPVKMQRLSRPERARAEKIQAARLANTPTPLSHLLAANGASSAIGSPSALTDGDPDTTWSEARGGDGMGEFVAMRAPSEVELTSFAITIRPPKRNVEAGSSPKTFFLATDDRLLEVTIPEDAWTKPGAAYVVKPPTPVRTSCVALVLDDSFGTANNENVTVAEVTALSEFDGTTDHAGLVGALAGGGQRAQAAAALLMRGGEPAQKAVVDGFDNLDEQGKRLAMGVIDTAACPASSRFFAPRLAAAGKQEREHARDRIRRCGRASAQALAEVMRKGDDKQRWAAAEELSAIDPATAIAHLGPMLAKADPKTRAAIRTLLARASGLPNSARAMGRLLDDPSLAPVAAIDVLRSSSAQVETVGLPAAASFARLSRGDLDTRGRFLLCEPGARLATKGDLRGVGFLYERILRDPEPMVRERAASVAFGIPALRPVLMTALEDENVRVRDAAAGSLSGVDDAQRYLVRRLLIDGWPRVRARAADSLASCGKGTESDEALKHALSFDDSARVRARIAAALGARSVTSAAPLLRERAEDPMEDRNVRVKSVIALGQVCDRAATSMLTGMAKGAGEPYATEEANQLGVAAIVALGRLHPADLAARLKPIADGKHTPRHVRSAARAALLETAVCK